jgi:SAM-dependent methyltransferase
LAQDAHRKIDFQCGSAAEMPFGNDSFDLIYSVFAIEQMNQILRPLFSEICRVSTGHVAMIEPFADSNADALRRIAKLEKDHLRISVADLAGFGIQPHVHRMDWPQKLTRGADFVYGTVASKSPAAKKLFQHFET